jgi:hypothetical protein
LRYFLCDISILLSTIHLNTRQVAGIANAVERWHICASLFRQANLALSFFWAANVMRAKGSTAATKKGGTSLLNREAHAALLLEAFWPYTSACSQSIAVTFGTATSSSIDVGFN